MGAQFTSGPWELDDGTIQHAESGSPICTVYTADDFPCVPEDDEVENDEGLGRTKLAEECDGNALLLTAAPDLFEAVDKLIEHAQPDNWDDAEEGVEHANAWRRAFNALAKATGRPAPYTLTEESV